MTTRELIEAAMNELENMPMGGVGKDGPERKYLDKCNEQGMPYADDASYHAAQSAWLYLDEALKQL